MNIAIQGCLHGELAEVYHQLSQLQQQTGIKIDALIICGDFQATRNSNDLSFMHCPEKYRQMGDFKKYYTGEKETPYLTIFIGGNHEAVNYMRDLYFGGWVAPKIYYIGQAGSIYLRKGSHKIRISGLSGIYNDYDWKYCLRTQRLPLMGKSKVSCYHIKQMEIFRMELLSRIEMMKKEDSKNYGQNCQNFDVFLTHDWPKDIALYGSLEKLYEFKGFLKKQIDDGSFGSPPSTRILSLAKPDYWFSAHMHVKFAALFPHPGNKFTHFLSLDKCLKNRSCLQVFRFQDRLKKNSEEVGENEEDKKVHIQLDETWLAVLKITLHLQNENKSLYKFNENSKSLQILDITLMNTFIQKYKEIRNEPFQQREKFQSNLVEWSGSDQEGTQIYQTLHLIEKILKQDPKMFKGTIFPIDFFEVQNEQKQNDEIQLEL